MIEKAPERYGKTRVAKIKAAYDTLRSAVRSGDFDAAEAALDRYEQWADYVFDARHAPQWRPISEAPRDGTELLCYVGPSYVGGSLILSWFKYNGTEAWRDWDCDAWEPTHFMFRPEAPNEP